MNGGAGGSVIPYLGSMLGDNPRHKSYWMPVLENMRVKLASWGSKFLSMSGRVVMLREVISSILIYHMAIFKALVWVIKEMEKMMRAFYRVWWGEVDEYHG